MRHRSTAALLAMAIMAGTPAVFAADKTVNVAFDPGKSSKSITSTITGEAGVDYTLAVKQGQVMQVLFSTTKGTCYFNAFEPGNADSAVHIGSAAGNEFGASPTKGGTYRFQVYQMRATARRNAACTYTISFEVTGEGTAGAAATAPGAAPKAAAGPSEVAKGACLFKMDVDADIVESKALKPGHWQITMKAKSGARKVACTVDDKGTVSGWADVK